MDEQTRLAVAEAILDHGSPRFSVPEGRMLDLLTEIAQRGDLAAFSEACQAYSAAIPRSRRVLEDYAPAKILSGFLCRQSGVDQSKAEAFRTADPQWSQRIQAALWTPVRLAGVVEDMLVELKALSAPPRSDTSS